MASQTTNGKALEYAFLSSLYENLRRETDVIVISSAQLETARGAYLSFNENDQYDMDRAADAGVNVIYRLEPKLYAEPGNLQLTIQEDAQGQRGDVRDVLAIRSDQDWEIGLSCKRNHHALKHSRLSNTIDIGEAWFGFQSTAAYFNEIRPIFDELADMQAQGTRWSQVDESDKIERYYIPIMEAFIGELRRLDHLYPGEIPRRLLSYLIGREDFYKVIANTRSQLTEIQGFNLYGTLNQSAGRTRPLLRMPRPVLPNRIYDVHFKDGSNNTVLIVCDQGWTISARIHNASSRVEKSLKLDVKLVGNPPAIFNHTEPWER